MEYQKLKELDLPDVPGVYEFRTKERSILYIGKATSLRDRVRSYFANDLLHTRGKHIVDMVTLADTVSYTQTDSVLEAVILEASEIKKHQPPYNTKEKDNKSFNYVVITNEEFPRVITIRERTMLAGGRVNESEYKRIFGPFPQGSNLSEALRIIRKIFPFRDMCIPESGTPCFNFQIGLCPGVCIGAISSRDYDKRIHHIELFFEGKKGTVISQLEKLMNHAAKKLEFEQAGEYKRMIFALKHIEDVSLVSDDIRDRSRDSARTRARAHRIEAFDVAHISGKYTVGVMAVVLDGYPKKSEYRKFKIRNASEKIDDPLHLEEVLRRRFAHTEWEHPDLLVVDGSVAQKRRAEQVCRELGISVPVVSVVKDERHKPRAFLGNKEYVASYRPGILIANAESHRFAVAYHRALRDRMP